MKDDEEALVVCGPETAKMLREGSPEIEEALVITMAIPEGDAIVVPKEEFIEYVYGHKEKDGK